MLWRPTSSGEPRGPDMCPHPLFTPRPHARRRAIEELQTHQILDAGELWKYEVLRLDGAATIGPFWFESDGSLGWLSVRRGGDAEPACLRLDAALHWKTAWFWCPACGRRCQRVFDPDCSASWRCRLCADLTYLSRRQSRRSHRTLGRDPKRQLELAIRMERGAWVRPWEAAAMEWLARSAIRRGRRPLAVSVGGLTSGTHCLLDQCSDDSPAASGVG